MAGALHVWQRTEASGRHLTRGTAFRPVHDQPRARPRRGQVGPARARPSRRRQCAPSRVRGGDRRGPVRPRNPDDRAASASQHRAGPRLRDVHRFLTRRSALPGSAPGAAPPASRLTALPPGSILPHLPISLSRRSACGHDFAYSILEARMPAINPSCPVSGSPTRRKRRRSSTLASSKIPASWQRPATAPPARRSMGGCPDR